MRILCWITANFTWVFADMLWDGRFQSQKFLNFCLNCRNLQLGHGHVIEGSTSSIDQLPSFLELELHRDYSQISSTPYYRPINDHLRLQRKQIRISLWGAFWRHLMKTQNRTEQERVHLMNQSSIQNGKEKHSHYFEQRRDMRCWAPQERVLYPQPPQF